MNTSRPPNAATIAAQSAAARPRNSPTAEPIYQTSAYLFPDLDTIVEAHDDASHYYFYSRQGSPNQTSLEASIITLEGAEAGAATSAGMAAITASCLAVARAGDHIVASSQLYGGTFELLNALLPSLGIQTEFVDAQDVGAVRRAIRDNTRAVYVETVSNPTMRVADLPALAEVVAAAPSRPALIVDNTFATPYGCRALSVGADLSIHSLSKFIGGHNDLIGGIVCGSARLIDQVRYLTRVFGWAITPFNAWLASRGLRTLWVRMQRANENAAVVAGFLAEHPRVRQIHYPGLPSHPDHAVARRVLQGGFGAMLAFEIDGFESVNRLMRSLRRVRFTPTLGGVSTTISHPATTSHRHLSPADRLGVGIPDGFVRLSVGIEDPGDIMDDLGSALEQH